MLDEKTVCSESGCDQEVCWKGYCASHGREKLPVTNCGSHCNKLRDVFTSKLVMEAVQCSCADCNGTNSATSEVTEDLNDDLYRYKIVVYRTKQSEVETIGIFDFKEGSATELYKFLSSRESHESRLKSHGENGLKPLTITEKVSSPITTEPLPEVVDISSLPSSSSSSSTSSLESLNMSVPESRVISPASSTSSVAPLSPAPTLPSPHSHIPSPRARVIPRSPTGTAPPHAAPGHHRSASLGSTPLTTAITTNTPHPGARPPTNAAATGSASAGKKPMLRKVGQVLTPVREMQQLAAQRRQSATAPKPTRPSATVDGAKVERRGSDLKSNLATPPVPTLAHSSSTGAGHRGSFSKGELMGSPEGRLTPSSRAAKSHLNLTAATQGPAPGPAPPSLLAQKSSGALPTPAPVTRRSSLPKIATRPGPTLQEREVTEYKDSKDLKRPDNPTEFMTATLHKLQSKNWKEEFHALDDVRALAIFYPDIVTAHFNALIPLVEAQVDNLRSSNAKNSLLCCIELFKRTGKFLDSHVAQLLPHLVKRAAEGTFIAKDGDIAIQTMIENVNPHRVLKGVFAFAQGDKATAIKSVLSKTLFLAIGKLNSKFLDHADLGQLCAVIAPYLYEKTPEIRTFAKDGVMALSRLATQSGKQKKLQEMVKRNVNQKFKDRFDEAVLQADKLSTPLGPAKRPSGTATNGITPKELKRLPSRDAPQQSPPSPSHATSPIPPTTHLAALGSEGTQTVPESPSSTLLTDRPDSPPDFI